MPLGENHLASELFTVFGVMASFKRLPVIESGISRTEWQQHIEIALSSEPRGARCRTGIRQVQIRSHWHGLKHSHKAGQEAWATYGDMSLHNTAGQAKQSVNLSVQHECIS